MKSEGEVEAGDALASPLEAVGIHPILGPHLGALEGPLVVAVAGQVIQIRPAVVSHFQVADLVGTSLALKVQSHGVGVIVVNDLGAGHDSDAISTTHLLEEGLDNVVHGAWSGEGLSPRTPSL